MASGSDLRLVDGSTALSAASVKEKRSYRFRTSLPAPFPVPLSGIYAIINRDNGKIYIGSSQRMNHRWTEHRSELEDKEHGNRYLQRAFLKNPDAFQIEVIKECGGNISKRELLADEQFWINFYQSYKPENGYNISPKADSCQGIKRDPEFVQRVAASLRGRRMSPERLVIHRRAMKGHKGRRFTQEQKQWESERKKGIPLPESTRKKLSELQRLNRYSAKPILQFSLDGHFIQRFKAIKDAEYRFGKRSNIHSVCKGKRRQCFGFVWRYASDSKSTDVIPVIPKKSRSTNRITNV